MDGAAWDGSGMIEMLPELFPNFQRGEYNCISNVFGTTNSQQGTDQSGQGQ